jgi:hypothetical protein
MKLSVVVTIAAVAAEKNVSRHRLRRQDEREVAKRYSQLIDQMALYNSEFDERKYWTYGCHCLMLGDRPMSEMGRGVPMDALDAVCRSYKECQKCARERYGEQCIGEFYKYDYSTNNNNSVCNDDADTCNRALCECDRRFAIDHAAATDVWTADYHRFYSNPEFDSDAQCIPNGGGNPDPQCCNNGDYSSPFIFYNANRKQCCSDGSVASIGNC